MPRKLDPMEQRMAGKLARRIAAKIGPGLRKLPMVKTIPMYEALVDIFEDEMRDQGISGADYADEEAMRAHMAMKAGPGYVTGASLDGLDVSLADMFRRR